MLTRVVRDERIESIIVAGDEVVVPLLKRAVSEGHCRTRRGGREAGRPGARARRARDARRSAAEKGRRIGSRTGRLACSASTAPTAWP